jgi:hypothetical protein
MGVNDCSVRTLFANDSYDAVSSDENVTLEVSLCHRELISQVQPGTRVRVHGDSSFGVFRAAAGAGVR